jgi:hypothetical protein
MYLEIKYVSADIRSDQPEPELPPIRYWMPSFGTIDHPVGEDTVDVELQASKILGQSYGVATTDFLDRISSVTGKQAARIPTPI